MAAGRAPTFTPAPPAPLDAELLVPKGAGAFSFSYPEGWVHGAEHGAITLGDSPAALANLDGRAVAGQLTLAIIWPISADVASSYGLWPLPKTYREAVTELVATNNHPKFTQGPSDITIGDRPATRIMGQDLGGGHDAILMLFLDTGPDNVTAVIAGAAIGEMPRFEPAILAVAAALSYYATGARRPHGHRCGLAGRCRHGHRYGHRRPARRAGQRHTRGQDSGVAKVLQRRRNIHVRVPAGLGARP